LECDGLSLGRGTWAEAYRRSAPGTRRRQALKMLCTLGIVTEKAPARGCLEKCWGYGETMEILYGKW